jgi:histidinol-phosphatase (PHP family)
MNQSPIPFDFHSHHRRCGHAVGEMAEYIEAAAARGMTTFGVSDHGPAYWLSGDHAQPGTQMACSEVSRYAAEAHALKERYTDRITVLVGIEADYIEGREADLKAVLDAHPFDYALGSVHYALGTSIFSKTRWMYESATDIYADYYRQVALAAESGLFDILSHLTAVEAYGPPVTEEQAALWYPPVADAVAASGCAVEINTSGYRKMGGDEPFPNRRMLRLLLERGIPLTFGSDCHRPDEVGFGAERVAALLTELGVSPTTVFGSFTTGRRKPAAHSGDGLGLHIFPTRTREEK